MDKYFKWKVITLEERKDIRSGKAVLATSFSIGGNAK